MMMIGLAALALVLAAIPALQFHANLREYRPPPAASRLPGDPNGPSLSVLIPAPTRNAPSALLCSRSWPAGASSLKSWCWTIIPMTPRPT